MYQGDTVRLEALRLAVEYHKATDSIPLAAEVAETADVFHKALTERGA